MQTQTKQVEVKEVQERIFDCTDDFPIEVDQVEETKEPITIKEEKVYQIRVQPRPMPAPKRPQPGDRP